MTGFRHVTDRTDYDGSTLHSNTRPSRRRVADAENRDAIHCDLGRELLVKSQSGERRAWHHQAGARAVGAVPCVEGGLNDRGHARVGAIIVRRILAIGLLIVVWDVMSPANAETSGKAPQGAQAKNTGKTAPATAGPPTASEPPTAEDDAGEEQPFGGIKLPDSETLRVRIRLMAGYGLDESQASLGFEKQGRVGYAIVELFGRLNESFAYRVEVNPVNETQPLPACGETNFFFPNGPQSFGSAINVACHNDGRLRVDDYRFVALDLLGQQGPIRQAYLTYHKGWFGLKGGRFVLPLGFGWEEAGSFTAKDATHIQRINAEASLGVSFSLTKRVRRRRVAEFSASGVLGDSGRYHDYDYVYGIDSSHDSNSWPTMVLSAAVAPVRGLEVRGALKRGDNGSKVERLPNFYASKRNDNAIVGSVRYRPIRHVAVFGEAVHYEWGLFKTSAEMLNQDTAPVRKDGYYVGADASYPITHQVRIGTVITREELSRDDALIKYLAAQNLYDLEMGRKERSTVLRFYADIANMVRVGVYRNRLSNPFPWVSGIQAVAGPAAFQGRGNDKWGVAFQFRLQ